MEDSGVDGKITLKCIFRKCDGEWTGLIWLRIGRDHLEDSGVGGRIILKCIFRKCDGEWTGLMWLRIGTSGGHL